MAKKNWTKIDVSTLNFHDPKTWALISAGKTDGVFQLESAGMKDVCIRLAPDTMEILIAILALYRPDTMAELEHFIRRKNGEEEVTYLHPDLEPILNKTYGCLIYQEQVMAIAGVFGGYTPAEQDKFRKGIGKKDKKLVKKEADKFYIRAVANGYPEEVCRELADYLAEMGGYMFNKGHATGYAITCYKTAWLKANHTPQFMCSLLSNQKKTTGATDYEGIGLYVVRSIELGVKVLNPDINKSLAKFSVINGDALLYGLELIKGIGSTPTQKILELRPFNSFEDFLERTEPVTEINKTVIISLVKSGAFDFTGEQRRDLLMKYGMYRFKNGLDSIKPITQLNKTHIQKMLEANIIKGYEVDHKELALGRWNKWRELQFFQEWEETVMEGNEFKWEYDSISYHLLGDPFADINIPKWDDFAEGDNECKIGGTVIAIKKTKIKKGKQMGRMMAFLSVDTNQGVRDVTVFADKYEQFQDKITKGAMMVMRGKKQGEGLILNGLKSLEDFKETEM